MPASSGKGTLKKETSETFVLLITHWTTFDVCDTPDMQIEKGRKTVI